MGINLEYAVLRHEGITKKEKLIELGMSEEEYEKVITIIGMKKTSTKEIIEAVGLDIKGIRAILKRFGMNTNKVDFEMLTNSELDTEEKAKILGVTEPTVEMYMQIISKYESGIPVNEIASAFDKKESTIIRYLRYFGMKVGLKYIGAKNKKRPNEPEDISVSNRIIIIENLLEEGKYEQALDELEIVKKSAILRGEPEEVIKRIEDWETRIKRRIAKQNTNNIKLIISRLESNKLKSVEIAEMFQISHEELVELCGEEYSEEKNDIERKNIPLNLALLTSIEWIEVIKLHMRKGRFEKVEVLTNALLQEEGYSDTAEKIFMEFRKMAMKNIIIEKPIEVEKKPMPSEINNYIMGLIRKREYRKALAELKNMEEGLDEEAKTKFAEYKAKIEEHILSLIVKKLITNGMLIKDIAAMIHISYDETGRLCGKKGGKDTAEKNKRVKLTSNEWMAVIETHMSRKNFMVVEILTNKLLQEGQFSEIDKQFLIEYARAAKIKQQEERHNQHSKVEDNLI